MSRWRISGPQLRATELLFDLAGHKPVPWDEIWPDWRAAGIKDRTISSLLRRGIIKMDYSPEMGLTLACVWTIHHRDEPREVSD